MKVTKFSSVTQVIPVTGCDMEKKPETFCPRQRNSSLQFLQAFSHLKWTVVTVEGGEDGDIYNLPSGIV